MLTRNRLSSNMHPENFKSSFLAALEDQEVVERYKLIFEPLLKSLVLTMTNKLSDTVTALTQTFSRLKNELAEKDSIIRELRSDVSHLQIAVEDLEQHGRKDSMRIFGMPENTPGSTDEKVLLVKFVSRRTKDRMMGARKKLRPKPQGEVPDEENRAATENEGDGAADDSSDIDGPIYIADDLTKARATLAYKVRVAKRNREITDTWVSNCNILVKDHHCRIHNIKTEEELHKIIMD